MIEIVQRFTERFPRPVCDGCPDPKRFDEQVEKWSVALAEQLAHTTGSRWGVMTNSVTGAGLVEQVGEVLRVHPWFVVDHPGGGKTIEYSPQLVSERRMKGEAMPGVSWVMPANHLHDEDRDRIGEALERLARIENAVESLANREHQRALTVTGFLQRLIILTTHYGTAASIFEFKVLGRTFRVEMTRPQHSEPKVREPY